MFDVGLGEMLVLVVLALVIFGDRLPKAASQAGRALRQLREMANTAQRDLKEGLGPEFADFDVTDLHPRNFVRKHLFDDLDDDFKADDFKSDLDAVPTASALDYGDRPPFDSEAT
ncbi:sec-independent translocase [Actinomadura sp. HBU206391]|uniref:sec-independent translocase n=1 Tax=Actinomadura sp. HBU206391 TaxID=2731692 RepID=UPI0016502C84|nr:sec-independent translocase [Actinomadura sp. HBU206391]MBC6463492.1 Sec-independent protein translocase subunit TatB [Actinomadura sp. HBU206391]